MHQQQNRRDIHRQITDHIVTAIERGAPKFEMPWHCGGVDQTRPTNAMTGKTYRGVNTVSLWAAAAAQSFFSGYWATYRQWQGLDAQVRRGEKASPIVFYKEITHEVRDETTGEINEERQLFARASWVFNGDQVDGWEEPFAIDPDPVDAIAEVEAFVAACGADIRHGGTQAYYAPSEDHIVMPARQRFTGTSASTATESYYATLLHELTHWTAHRSRLDRDLSRRFGDEAYAMEELVAELGSAFLCAELSITNVPRPNHAAYVASWLKVLKSDVRAIFTASRKATTAAGYLAGFRETELRNGGLPITR